MVSLIVSVVVLAGVWRVFQKMGRPGWECLIPFYNTYVLFKVLYGSGWRMLTLLIPFYNIYVSIKACIDLAHAFHQTTGFGWGIFFVSVIFLPILGFGNYTFRDGSADLTGGKGVFEQVEEAFNGKSEGDAEGPQQGQPTKAASEFHRYKEAVDTDLQHRQSMKTAEELKKYKELLDAGILTQEEFDAKKAELLKQL